MLTGHETTVIDSIVVLESGIEELGQAVVGAPLQLWLVLFGGIKQFLRGERVLEAVITVTSELFH